MTVNRELVAKLVNDIREATLKARELVSKPFNELSYYELLALRYLVIELVEAAATLCAHILKNLYGIIVEGYPQCFTRMTELGLIPRDLAENLARAARLRNILVHRYWVVDDRKLYDLVLKGLKDFEAYVEAVERITGK